ncbi:efflux RND transporter permease subunit [Vibrio sp. DW001]|uniref:efflux RND transporter permease subunit n=1 Tax=Vibrio sp. DW001 TaxID=2912315 RepID=UPI0023B10CD2|nr:efflux RND transporter permease subunit [Vibrio sp. DW001]WED28923.1 efflux RND transporter permease subunit [Vibrio sp. DW001]
MKYANIISNSRLMVLIVAFLVVGGFSALNTLPRAEDPAIVSRNATISTIYPGANATRVESLVTEVIENELRQLSEIIKITSTSRLGVSIISLELDDTIVDIEPIWSKVRDKLSDVEPELPQSAHTPDLDTDSGQAFTLMISLNWQGSGEEDLLILGRYAKELATRFRILSGTAFVEDYGLLDEEISVNIDVNKAAALGYSSQQLASALDGADVKNSAGELVNDSTRFGLEISSNLDSIERVRQVPISINNVGHTIRIGDVADVQRSYKTPYDELALIDGKPGVIVAIRMQSNLRVDKWTPSAINLLDEFRDALPSNIKADVIFSQQPYTEVRLLELTESLIIGFSLVLIVLLFTLGFRAALIIALSLPLTMLTTLSLMKYLGVPIDQMSVTGFIVALGIMVDNAVVMVDTIQSYRLKGKAKLESAMLAIQHLWTPLLGSTLTTVLAFAPIFLMPGATGEFVGSIALTVSFSLVGSYVISHTVIASISSIFLPSKTTSSNWYQTGISIPILSKWFGRSVAIAIRHPLITIALTMMLPIFGYWSTSQLTEQFFPASDRDMFEVQVYLPTQASIYATKSATEQIHAFIADNEDVEQVNWLIGSAFPSFYYNMVPPEHNAPFFSHAMVKTTNFEAANRLIPKLQSELDNNFPQAQILVRKLEQGPPFTAPIELRVYGNDLTKLKSIGEDIRLILSNIDHVTHTRESLPAGIPQFELNVDEEAIQLNGLNLNQFAGLLQSTLVGNESGSIIEGTESIPLRVSIKDKERENYDDLNNLRFPVSSNGKNTGVSVLSLSELELIPSIGGVTRRNGRRVNTIEGYIESSVLPQTVLDDFKKELENYPFPTGYAIEFGGEAAERDESVNQLVGNVSVVAVLMVLVVVLSFNSFRLSAVIFVVAGLAAGLGIFSIWLFSYPFGFTAIIALLGVVGLAINAAIVIIAELRSCPDASQGNSDAILTAVMSCTRHITSTTITTIGGFLPLILAGGGFWPPFAVAIAGGTALTTLLSFYFVPSVFKLLTKMSASIAAHPVEVAQS